MSGRLPFVNVSLCAVLAVFGFAAAAAAPGAAQNGGEVAEGQRLLAEGDLLADEGKYDAAVLKYMDAYEALLPSMRKLPFKREVKGHFTPRKDMKGLVEKMFEEEIKPEELRADEMGLKALGLIPHDMDLKETMVRLMSEEMAGFYDSRKETMHLIHEDLVPPRPKGQKPGFFEWLFGDPDEGRFEKDENKQVLAHELTHALADQNFDLDKMQEAAKDDSDRSLALMALIEGEAMLTMAGAAAEDWTGESTPAIPAGALAVQMNVLSSMAGALGGKVMRDVPPVLRDTLIFPYTKGLVFVAHQTNAGGWAALDGAYANPPLSTEQVLHPEKYGSGPEADPPTALDLGELKPGDEWKELDRDVVGELVTGIMLAKHGGRKAAAGWDGDTAAIFEGPDDKLGLVWLSTWDSEADAREFARGYAAFQTAKFAPAVKQASDEPAAEEEAAAEKAEGEDAEREAIAEAEDAGNSDERRAAAPAPAPDRFPADDRDDVLQRPLEGGDGDERRVLHVEVRGRDVLVIEGFTSDATKALAKSAFAAARSEKTNKPAAAPENEPGQEADE